MKDANDKDFQGRLFAAVTGIKDGVDEEGWILPKICRWFAREMPEEWEKYLQYVGEMFRLQNFSDDETGVLNAQLSIHNLAQFIVDNYKEMFFEECQKCKGQKIEVDNRYTKGYREINCTTCNSTGKTVIPSYAEAVEIIRRYLDGKQ